MVPTIVGLSVVLFAFIHLLPGDPIRVILGPRPTPEAIAQLRATLRLDEPLPVQYIDYLARILRGDLGTSVITGRSVLSEFAVRFLYRRTRCCSHGVRRGARDPVGPPRCEACARAN